MGFLRETLRCRPARQRGTEPTCARKKRAGWEYTARPRQDTPRQGAAMPGKREASLGQSQQVEAVAEV
jgi:hypothetical protein